VELYLHSPNTPSWRGAQLKKAQVQLYLLLFTRFNDDGLVAVALRKKLSAYSNYTNFISYISSCATFLRLHYFILFLPVYCFERNLKLNLRNWVPRIMFSSHVPFFCYDTYRFELSITSRIVCTHPKLYKCRYSIYHSSLKFTNNNFLTKSSVYISTIPGKKCVRMFKSKSAE